MLLRRLEPEESEAGGLREKRLRMLVGLPARKGNVCDRAESLAAHDRADVKGREVESYRWITSVSEGMFV